MILRHLRTVIALSFLALAVAVGADSGRQPGGHGRLAGLVGTVGIKLLEVPASEANNPRAWSTSSTAWPRAR